MRSSAAAEHAHAADRFAREILAILSGSTQRSRRLMGNPLGRLALIFLDKHVTIVQVSSIDSYLYSVKPTRMAHTTPGEVELSVFFRRHRGPRFESAGLRVQFHYNQLPGIHFKVAPPEEYREAIAKGILEGLALHFPDFPANASVWVLEITAHDVDSSQRAFYTAGRMVIDQAFALAESSNLNELP